jgi:hypothetical protein
MPKVDYGPLRESSVFSRDRVCLAQQGHSLVTRFCALNGLRCPNMVVSLQEDWHVGACAYYRPQTIHICPEECGWPCGAERSRNWSWPGSTVDREPYGVVCHELGHHCDWHRSPKKGSYGGDYSERVMKECGEPGLTSYADANPWEWFAEAFRLFVTNPELLKLVRPLTYKLIAKDFRPAVELPWDLAMGADVPQRVLQANRNKMRVLA